MAGTALSLYETWISYRTGRMCKCSLFLVLFQRLVTSVVGLSYLVGIYTYVHVGLFCLQLIMSSTTRRSNLGTWSVQFRHQIWTIICDNFPKWLSSAEDEIARIFSHFGRQLDLFLFFFARNWYRTTAIETMFRHLHTPPFCKLTACQNLRIANKTRNSSGDEIANVNFLYDDIVHVAYYKTQ